ncbi:MAG: ASCH domain-containing protein [Clostridia bacterium]|nr:ASCH domain-containing protein [Clostridia bacterium]
MLHDMKLYKKPFEQIKQGTKTIELRLFDEKRQKIRPMDEIRFTQTQTGETLTVKVYALHIYADFQELYRHFDKIQLGYDYDEECCYEDMYAYYSMENIEKYGVLAIELIR